MNGSRFTEVEFEAGLDLALFAEYELGCLVGPTDASPDGTSRWPLEYELGF